ncbi:hypothetical protein JTB14_018841 [Gonioctena quinquepunctata]|nr:hypothetical protein JTB14_018841 [Gonioctena quinquepunctata]
MQRSQKIVMYMVRSQENSVKLQVKSPCLGMIYKMRYLKKNPVSLTNQIAKNPGNNDVQSEKLRKLNENPCGKPEIGKKSGMLWRIRNIKKYMPFSVPMQRSLRSLKNSEVQNVKPGKQMSEIAEKTKKQEENFSIYADIFQIAKEPVNSDVEDEKSRKLGDKSTKNLGVDY